MQAIFRAQPRAFSLIFTLELWERFGYYTVQGILTLYFIRYLGFSETDAYFSYGAFFAIVYGMVALGGYLGDHVLGTKRTITLGLILLALGYLALAFTDKAHVFYALGLVCVGNGVFKANPANLLSKCYAPHDPRLHSGFTLYYMAINLGSIFALLMGPTLSSHYGYGYAYFMSFVGLTLGLATFAYWRNVLREVHTPADEKIIPKWLWAGVLLGVVLLTFAAAFLLQHVFVARKLLLLVTCIVLSIYYYHMRHESKQSYVKMLIAFVLMLEAVVFFVLYQQMSTSINLFAVHHVFPILFGIPIDPQSFQVLNPLWIIVMSPIVATSYNRLQQRGVRFAIPYKFAAGMLCCGVSFLILFCTRYFQNEAGMVSSSWMVVSYFFQGTGELFVSALGVAMVAELVPQSITGFVMGMWFLTSSIAGFIGASVASFTALPREALQQASFMQYTHVFACIGGVALLLGFCMWCVAPRLSRYIN